MSGTDIALERRGREVTLLRVAGRLRPGWCGNLAMGLAALDIDITRGHATSEGAGFWSAQLELLCPADDQPTREQIARLLESNGAAGFTLPLDLLSYGLAPSTRHGGCLLLELEAPNRVGFLAALLRRLAYFSLFPVELQLETSAGAARDRLWLRGGGDSLPAPRVAGALRVNLDALVGRSSGGRARC